MKLKIATIILLMASLVYVSDRSSYSESIDEMNRKAHNLYEDKKYNQAIALWLDILTMEPDNQRVMQKIEEVYEIKQKKDLAYQKSRLDYHLSKMKLKEDKEEEIEKGISIGWNSIGNYRIAFRLDPNDSDIKEMRERMAALEKEILAAQEALRLSREIKMKIQQWRFIARDQLDKNDFDNSLKNWEEILDYLPRDTEAIEGKRTCLLAIENRIKFEKIRGYLAKGKELFDVQQYKSARNEYTMVISLDERNREANDYIEKIDEMLEEKMLLEIRLQQAENLYKSGVEQLGANNFDQARDDFESILSLLKNRDYKDTKQKLAMIEVLRKEYELKERQRRVQMIDEYFQEGLIAFNDSRYNIAIAKFDKTLSLDKENRYAREYLDKSIQALKQKQEEVVDENSPYFQVVNALIVSGKELYLAGRYTESTKKWERILRLFPKNRLAREYSLKCYYRMNPDKLDSFSNNLFESGQKLLAGRKYKDALDKFLLLKSVNERYPNIDEYVARSKIVPEDVGPGDTPLAAVDRQEIERKYRAAMALYQRGGKQNIEESLAMFRWIVQKSPNNVKAVINVNKIEAQLRINKGGAATGLAQLTPEMRRKAQRHYYNGISYYASNKFKKAIDEWQKVLIIDPGNVKAKNNIRKTMAFLGRYGNE
ncbi:MAG: hypothetical protein JXA20_06075 [Spirochaetes bacterium]|nr:hypothetical protein [Spirochaetota bacterium]